MENYLPIKLSDLTSQQVLGFDVYLYLSANSKFIRYISGKIPIDEKQLQRLQFRKVDQLFIKTEEKEKYNKYISNTIKKRLSETNESNRPIVVKEIAAKLITDITTITGDGDAVTWTNNCLELTKTIVTDLTETA